MLYLGRGDGTFQQGTQIYRQGAVVVTANDFNAGKKLDLFLEYVVGMGAPQVPFAFGILRLGVGDGTSFLDLPVQFGPQSPTSVTSSDLNGDGLPDLILADGPNNAVRVVLKSSPKSGADLALTLDVPQQTSLVAMLAVLLRQEHFSIQ